MADTPTPAITINAAEGDALASVLRPLLDLIITIRTIDCEQPIDAYLDTVTIVDGWPQLQCRHITERCIPIGPAWTVPATQLATIHIW